MIDKNQTDIVGKILNGIELSEQEVEETYKSGINRNEMVKLTYERKERAWFHYDWGSCRGFRFIMGRSYKCVFESEGVYYAIYCEVGDWMTYFPTQIAIDVSKIDESATWYADSIRKFYHAGDGVEMRDGRWLTIKDCILIESDIPGHHTVYWRVEENDLIYVKKDFISFMPRESFERSHNLVE